MISIEVQGIDKLDRKLKGVSKNLAMFPIRFNRLAHDFGNVLQPEMQKQAPKNKGDFAKSLNVDVRGGGGDYQLFLISGSGLLPIIQKGTKPHVILPKTKNGVLVFEGKGGKVFTKRVNHPGTKPNDFKQRALKRSRPKLRRLIDEFKKDLLKV